MFAAACWLSAATCNCVLAALKGPWLPTKLAVFATNVSSTTLPSSTLMSPKAFAVIARRSATNRLSAMAKKTLSVTKLLPYTGTTFPLRPETSFIFSATILPDTARRISLLLRTHKVPANLASVNPPAVRLEVLQSELGRVGHAVQADRADEIVAGTRAVLDDALALDSRMPVKRLRSRSRSEAWSKSDSMASAKLR